MRVKRKSSVWVAGSVLADELGCCQETVDRLRRTGVLLPKTHWRTINPNAVRPTYRYHRHRCESFLNEVV